MNRRAFLAAIAGGILAAPLAADAQQAGKVWRIGVLGFAPSTADMVGPDPKNAFTNALLRGLRELGYVYGQHFVTEPRGAEGRVDAYPSLVAELIRTPRRRDRLRRGGGVVPPAGNLDDPHRHCGRR